jgi:deferrochelatase/peroxidase EfeB
MCYQSDIANQFEFIQSNWVNNGNIGGHLVGQDGIIGQGENTFKKALPKKWGNNEPTNACNFSNPNSGFVKMKGGEYFFTPSISFLKSIASRQSFISKKRRTKVHQEGIFSVLG